MKTIEIIISPTGQTRLETKGFNPIDEGQAEKLIADDNWWMQEKFDGRRILIRKDLSQVIGINRKGLQVALPRPIIDQALITGGLRWLMDGEAVGDIYFAFDLLEQETVDLRTSPYSHRLDALGTIVAPGGRAAIRVRGTATGTAQNPTSPRHDITTRHTTSSMHLLSQPEDLTMPGLYNVWRLLYWTHAVSYM